MAAPAPARKPARSSGQEVVGLPAWFRDGVGKAGYSARPVSLTKNLFRALEKTELGVLEVLLDRTVGDWENDRPQWAHITIAEFVEWIGASQAGIRAAIAMLETLKLIKSERWEDDKRERVYSALLENWGMPVKRPPVEVSEEAVEETVEEANTASPLAVLAKLTVAAGAKSKAEIGSIPYEFRNRTKSAISIEATGSSSRIFIELTEQYRQPTGGISTESSDAHAAHSPRAGTRKAGRGHFFSGPTPSGRIEALRDRLRIPFLRLFEKLPDDALLALIDSKLGDATLEHYDRLCDQKRRKLGDRAVETGMYVWCAEEAGKAAAELASLNSAKQAAQAKEREAQRADAVSAARRALADPRSDDRDRELAREILAEAEE